ncbi:hypothetical protein Tco_0163163 [Tanacetum coccineum]
MKGFTPRLMDQEMNERLEDPAQGEKSQWDAFSERNRDAAATKGNSYSPDMPLFLLHIPVANRFWSFDLRAKHFEPMSWKPTELSSVGHLRSLKELWGRFYPPRQGLKFESCLGRQGFPSRVRKGKGAIAF